VSSLPADMSLASLPLPLTLAATTALDLLGESWFLVVAVHPPLPGRPSWDAPGPSSSSPPPLHDRPQPLPPLLLCL
jgi:hypothetical protein